MPVQLGHQRHWPSAAAQGPTNSDGSTQAVAARLLHRRPGPTSQGQHQVQQPSQKCGRSQRTQRASKSPLTMATRPTPMSCSGLGTTRAHSQRLHNSQHSATIPTLHRVLARNQAHKVVLRLSMVTPQTHRLPRTSRSTPMATALHRLHRLAQLVQRLQ